MEDSSAKLGTVREVFIYKLERIFLFVFFARQCYRTKLTYNVCAGTQYVHGSVIASRCHAAICLSYHSSFRRLVSINSNLRSRIRITRFYLRLYSTLKSHNNTTEYTVLHKSSVSLYHVRKPDTELSKLCS